MNAWTGEFLDAYEDGWNESEIVDSRIWKGAVLVAYGSVVVHAAAQDLLNIYML